MWVGECTPRRCALFMAQACVVFDERAIERAGGWRSVADSRPGGQVVGWSGGRAVGRSELAVWSSADKWSVARSCGLSCQSVVRYVVMLSVSPLSVVGSEFIQYLSLQTI